MSHSVVASQPDCRIDVRPAFTGVAVKLRCEFSDGPCANPAHVVFEISPPKGTVRMLRCREHAPTLRAVLASLIRPEQWTESAAHCSGS
jgi:hypothetical protein